MNCQELYLTLKEYSKVMLFHKPVSKQCLDDFQKDNEISLPKSLSDLLMCFDGGEIFVPGTVLYGIDEKINQITLKMVNGKQNRRIFNIPTTYLIIGKLNYGDWLCIDLNGDNNVIQWDHEQNKEFCRWDSLEDWINETIENYLEYEDGVQL